MAMGSTGMGEMYDMHHHMEGPANYLHYGSPGQFGTIEMSGMFTVLKVREGITNYDNPGWYQNPPGTVAESINKANEDIIDAHIHLKHS